jgi:hypothetical protein
MHSQPCRKHVKDLATEAAFRHGPQVMLQNYNEGPLGEGFCWILTLRTESAADPPDLQW